MGQISAFEFTEFSGTKVLFSAGFDGKIRAWSVDITNAQQALTPMDEKEANSVITSLAMAGPTFVVAGLQNGSLAGWNLNSNQVDILQAHQAQISCMQVA